jgi:hypothetical protein
MGTGQLSGPIYGPNVPFNGNSITCEALREQVENAIRTFPQRSWQFISGPTVTPAMDSPGATINYQLSGVLSNGTTGMQVKTSVQLTVEKEGDQFKIAAIWPPVLDQRPPLNALVRPSKLFRFLWTQHYNATKSKQVR